MEHQNSESPDREYMSPEAREQLKNIFKQLPHDIPIYFFTHSGEEDDVTHVVRELMGQLQKISSGKLRFEEYDLDHSQARKWQVDRSPTRGGTTGGTRSLSRMKIMDMTEKTGRAR
jgi:hypothetical protein